MLLDLNGFKLVQRHVRSPRRGRTPRAGSEATSRDALEGSGQAYRMGGDEFCALISLDGGAPEPMATAVAAALDEER